MSHLEALKERLKRKPEVRPNEGVRVVLAPPVEERVVKIDTIKERPIITAEKDEGKRAQEILEKIKQKKLSTVIKKLPEEPKLPLESKAPIIQEKKQRKPKKLGEDIIIQEEEEKIPEELPEGGPRLEDMVEEKVAEEIPIDDRIHEEEFKEEIEAPPKIPRKREQQRLQKV